jgi:hypothetical protein
MTRRPRLLLFALLCLTPVVLGVTLRYGENDWLVPAGLLPLFLLGPARILPWSLLGVALFWSGLWYLRVVLRDPEWQAKWCTVRGLALLSLVSAGLVVGSLAMVTWQWGVLAPSWAGAAATAWALYLLFLTRDLPTQRPDTVLLLRLWLVASLVPSIFAFLYGTLAGLCC